MQGAQPRQGRGPTAPAPTPAPGWRVTWSLPQLLSASSASHSTRHMVSPEAQASPARGSQLCPSSGATQQPQAVWVPSPTNKPGSGLGTWLSWASPP